MNQSMCVSNQCSTRYILCNNYSVNIIEGTAQLLVENPRGVIKGVQYRDKESGNVKVNTIFCYFVQ